MIINEFRENDLNKIIEQLRWAYTSCSCEQELNLRNWVERGKPIKKVVLSSTRKLYGMAEKNLDYLIILYTLHLFFHLKKYMSKW